MVSIYFLGAGFGCLSPSIGLDFKLDAVDVNKVLKIYLVPLDDSKEIVLFFVAKDSEILLRGEDGLYSIYVETARLMAKSHMSKFTDKAGVLVRIKPFNVLILKERIAFDIKDIEKVKIFGLFYWEKFENTLGREHKEISCDKIDQASYLDLLLINAEISKNEEIKSILPQSIIKILEDNKQDESTGIQSL